jgi:hypothetical protein
MTSNTMATLAKLKPEPGIWADRAPIPEPGPRAFTNAVIASAPSCVAKVQPSAR